MTRHYGRNGYQNIIDWSQITHRSIKTMFGSLSAHKRQTWFWVAVAVVLSIAAFVFHLLSIHRENIICSEWCLESDNEWAICRQIILFAFAAATLLLLTIAGYSQFHIRKHLECRFKDVFSQTFHHYWVLGILHPIHFVDDSCFCRLGLYVLSSIGQPPCLFTSRA